MKVVVVSDTHSPRHWKACPPTVAEHLEGADVILHGGDVCTVDVLEVLSQWAPVHVVMGNNDLPEVADWGARETLELDLDGLRVGMIHDSGPTTGRVRRLRRQFPKLILSCTATHIPMDITEDDLRVFNPGSPTDKRRQPYGTLGTLDIRDGQLLSANIIQLPR